MMYFLLCQPCYLIGTFLIEILCFFYEVLMFGSVRMLLGLTPPVGGQVDPRAIVQLEELGQLKNPLTSLGIKPATFQLVA
jgi:hypothetical protein